MEVARLKPFLDTGILFLLTSNFEKNLKQEIWLCHKYMEISLPEIYEMTIADRKYYISLHNRIVEKEKDRFRNNK